MRPDAPKAEECEVSDDEPPPKPGGQLAAASDTGASGGANGNLPIEDSQWLDWRWQMRNRIRTARGLANLLPQAACLDGALTASGRFPLAITPYYASLIRKPDPSDPIFAMCVPQVHELVDYPSLRDDPLEEDEDMPVPGLVHRYPDRALLLATTTCASYCRH
jgi:lysine 2,3-aminomutase